MPKRERFMRGKTGLQAATWTAAVLLAVASPGSYPSQGEPPNLRPFQPPGWSDAIVVSNRQGDNIDSQVLQASDRLYVDFAVINAGGSPVSAPFRINLYVDGRLIQTFDVPSPLDPQAYRFREDYPIGRWGTGTHTLRIVADAGDSVAESDESDNEYTRTIIVGGGCFPLTATVIPRGGGTLAPNREPNCGEATVSISSRPAGGDGAGGALKLGGKPVVRARRARTFAALGAKARSEERVRVIVGLRTGVRSGAALVGGLQEARTRSPRIARTQQSLLVQMSIHDVSAVRRFKFIPYVAMEVDKAGLEALSSDPEVVSIEEDRTVEPVLADSTSLIGAPDAWSQGFSGSGQAVAILDTGVDKHHPFLSGKVVSEACYSGGGDAEQSFCPGGVTESTTPGSGMPCPPDFSGCFHGTAVAGVAAGDGPDFSGVARDAHIIAIQVFSRCGEDCTTSTTSDWVAGLERVLELSADFDIAAANMSFGGALYKGVCDAASPAAKAAMDNLGAAGIASVVASANNSSSTEIAFPACISSAVSVGSTDGIGDGTTREAVSDFSNSSPLLDLLAPGRQIQTPVPGNGFDRFNGTSLATSHVSGAWAVLKSKAPNATAPELLSLLSRTGFPIADSRNGLIKPRIQVDAALNAVIPELSYSSGTRLTLTAAPNPGFRFILWRGCDDSSGNRCFVEMNAAKEVTAVFEPLGDAADLLTTSLTAPGVAAAGKEVAIAATIRNGGSADAGPFRLGFYLSEDPDISLDDTWFAACAYEAGLAAGRSATCRRPFPIPHRIVPGRYTLGAIVDDLDRVAEKSETNNALAAGSGPLEVLPPPRPDLITTSLMGPPTAAVGTEASISASIRNQGPANAGPFRLGLYLSADTTITTNDTWFAACTYEAGLPAGESETCSGSFPIPPQVSPGRYFLGAIVDDLDRVAEKSETNNALAAGSGPLEVLPPPRPDLITTSLMGPPTAAVGTEASISASIRNQGPANAGPFRLGLYLSADTTITTDDTWFAACTYEAGLPAGESETCSGSFPIPPQVSPGRYFLGAIVDDLDRVAEKSETNNALVAGSGPLEVLPPPRPDLITTSLMGPPTAAVGTEASISASIRNQGPANLVCRLPVRSGWAFICLLTPPLPQTSLTPGLPPAPTRRAFRPGESETCSGSFPIPPQVSPGRYFLGAIVDDLDRVAEKSETNNALVAGSGPLEVLPPPRPDLVTTSLMGPPTATIGSAASISAGIRNQGPANAGPFRLGLYLSADTTITTDDTWFAACSYDAGLQAGESETCSGSFPIPPQVSPGRYFLGTIVDDLDRVAENNETNNARVADSGPLDVLPPPRPDLITTSLLGPPMVAVGTEASISAGIRNQGPANAGPFRLGLYLSADTTITTDDTWFAACSYDAGLQAGESETCSGSFPIPPQVSPGRYFLGTIVDDLDRVAENNETNNARVADSGPLDVLAARMISRSFVPVLLTAEGRRGSFFTSELTLTNRGSQEARLDYAYTAHAGGGSGTAFDLLAPGEQQIEPDALGYLQRLGIPIPASGNRIGTLEVEALATEEVGVLVRTTTLVPEGRAGLAYPGIATEAGFHELVYLCGLRQNSRDRSNVALQHMGTTEDGPITLYAWVHSGENASAFLKEVKLEPGGFRQFSGVLSEHQYPHGYVEVRRASGTAPFYAYGVINDNFNSDGSFVFPVRKHSLEGKRGQTLPVIVETRDFSSELTVTNFSEEEKKLNFSFVADRLTTTDRTSRFSLTIGVGEQQIIPDVIDTEMRRKGVDGVPLGRGGLAGALFATVESGDMSGIVIGARTGTPDGRGGQYGVFYNAVPDGAAFTGSAWVDGLQQNAENRSNLALVNTGEVDDTESVFDLDIYDGDTGLLVRTVATKPLPARRWRQINAILADHAPGTTQGYIRVRQVSGNNPFLAYGVVNDGGAPGQRSGDGAYVPARE